MMFPIVQTSATIKSTSEIHAWYCRREKRTQNRATRKTKANTKNTHSSVCEGVSYRVRLEAVETGTYHRLGWREHGDELEDQLTAAVVFIGTPTREVGSRATLAPAVAQCTTFRCIFAKKLLCELGRRKPGSY